MAQSIFDDEMDRRLQGGDPTQHPLELPGTTTQDMRDLRNRSNSVPPNGAGAGPGPSLLSPLDKARADYLVREVLKAIRNTNITASEPAHAVPMLFSTPIDQSARFVLPGAVSAYTTVLSYTAPPGRWARIEAYGVDVSGGFTYDGSILWQFMLNGAPIQDLYDWGEHRGSLIQPSNTYFLVPMGQTVFFQVRRAIAAGSPNNVDMVFKGYTWRLRDDYEGTKASVTAF
jgi:hypothetical protein